MKKKENEQPLEDENKQDIAAEAQTGETITDEKAAPDELEEMKKKNSEYKKNLYRKLKGSKN